MVYWVIFVSFWRVESRAEMISRFVADELLWYR